MVVTGLPQVGHPDVVQSLAGSTGQTLVAHDEGGEADDPLGQINDVQSDNADDTVTRGDGAGGEEEHRHRDGEQGEDEGGEDN